jgi:hypothetical protein
MNWKNIIPKGIRVLRPTAHKMGGHRGGASGSQTDLAEMISKELGI